MSQRTRQWRRSQRHRILNRRLRMEKFSGWTFATVPNGYSYWDSRGQLLSMDTWDDVFNARLIQARKQINTHTPCSCPMCGNPRKHFGLLTLPEIKHRLSTAEQFDEIGLNPIQCRGTKTVY